MSGKLLSSLSIQTCAYCTIGVPTAWHWESLWAQTY